MFSINHVVAPLATAAVMLSTAAFAADAAKGEKEFKSCKACHTIASADEVIFKGGKTGPNLYGIIGRQAGSFEGYKYGSDIIAAGASGLVWNEELLVAYVKDPKAFLTEFNGEKSKSKMTYKKKDASNIIAYLASVSPVAETTDAPETAPDEAAPEQPAQ